MALPPPTDPLYARQWYLTRTNVQAVWEDYTGIGVHVGIFDFDGADYNHYELDANADPDRNFVYNGTTIDPTTVSVRNHATSLAGVIAGERNGTGIVGIAYDASFTVVPLIFNGNDRDPNYFGAAMAYQNAFDVTNLSWNFQPFVTGPSSALWQNMKGGIGAAALTGRKGLGTVMVATPSNDRKGDQWGHGAGDANAAGPHANDRHVVVVAGVGSDNRVADYSAPGASLLVSAPAQGHWSSTDLPGIWATDRIGTAGFNRNTTAEGGDFVETVGTSFAAPQVAGIVALMLEANPRLGWRDVREILALSATHVGSAIPATASTSGSPTAPEHFVWTINGADNWNGGGMHFSNDYGFGMIDARAAVRLAETWQLKQTSLNEAHNGTALSISSVIPDGTGALSIPVTIGAGIDIETISLSLNLQHTSARELLVLLQSPSGTTSTLLANGTADDIDLNGWSFTSNAFAGEESGGTWTLIILDTVPSNPITHVGNTGFITGGSLDVYGSRASQDDTYFYTDEFGAAGRIRNETERETLNDSGGHDTVNAAAVTGSVRIDLDGFTVSNIAGRNLVIADGTIEDAIGGDGADFLLGSAAANELWGGRGGDTLNGEGGNDRLHGGADGDFLNGYGDADTAWGEGGDDHLNGGAGDDVLHGGFALESASRGADGNDTVNGEAGNDTLIVSYGNDILDGGDDNDTLSFEWMGADLTVDLAAGTGTFFETGFLDRDEDGEFGGGDQFWGSRITATWKNMENLRGGSGGDKLAGDGFANILDGRGGADTMTGRGGADTYLVDNAADQVVEAAGGGVDKVLSSVSYTLAAGQEIEALQLLSSTGSASLSLTGNEFGQSLVGNNGTNVLDGKGGADVLTGRGGNDTYLVDNAGDRVVEASGGGTDKVFASTSYALQAGQEIEGLQLLASTGSANLNLTGNEISQSLVGNNGNNVLDGGVGRDAMTGRGGNDTYIVDNLGDRVTEAVGGGKDTVLCKVSYALAAGQEIEALQLLTSTGSSRFNLSGNEFGQSLVGNSGANVLDGKGGADVLTGRAGADSFLFSTALGAGNVDRIVDFAAEDTVRLSKSIFSTIAPGPLAEGAFKNVANITNAKLDADDRILYKQTTGELFYDADGSGNGGATLFAVLDNKAALTQADFLVV